jgi:hypothetical protein
MSDSSGGKQGRDLGPIGYFSAIILCCIIVGGLTYSLGRENQRRNDTPASYAKAAKADAQSACIDSKGAAAFECIYEKVEAAQEQARGEQDLSAQQKAASAALLSALIAFATLILSGFGVWYVKRTLEATLEAVEDTGKATEAMEKQNRIAEDTAKRQLRAYVSTDDEMVVGFYHGGPAIFSAKIHNRGQTPAYDLKVWSIVTASIENPDTAKIKHRGGFFDQSSAVLGPGQWVIHENGCQGPLNNDSFIGIATGGIYIIFAGIISYKDTFGRRRLSTFKLFHRGDGDITKTKFDLATCGRGNKSN